jgi:DNA-binding Lrp family transcriptional regulator
MSKTTVEENEEDENTVLAELMMNSQQSIERLAKKCGFSSQKTRRIMKRLENRKKIWGFSISVDSQKLGLEKYLLLIKRTQLSHEQQDIDEIVKNLLAPTKRDLGINVISSYRIHGEYDWVMLFTASNIVSAKKFSEAIMQKFPGRQSYQLNQILFTVRENYIQNPNIIEMKEFI